ncbi:tubulin-like doman-containing protein [Streptomyces sp. ALI-76-A]|uniref:tubulin-like doman-containing protein n=1 Tax=Streptomyces sp. ALI-76-A TaxID=3025736 RepID=UPI00256EA88A|nr:tubulin-like doman-containing protein [Streptomyces sp. ALI-76-A]MDL5205245.1 tubulin-like doman-containing protein [Streptomyces sp. ALI-76-A]
MKIFQPMLFVGLGGTGGLVGAELERRLRAELCGPDGTALNSLGIPLRYQLPECLQFVYADFSESELARLPHLSADNALRAAYSRTARATHDLLPDHDSSPEVTRELRAVMRDEVSGWLPPRTGEPKVTPLRNGAGQLPTVGRAALFGTLRNGLDSVMGPLLQAIDAISRSGGELSQLGGGPMSGCDVFVAYSVAGGTGAGLFLDYLHLIGEAFRAKNFTGARIYPLVVMPSAFPPSAGGGREAELNAARAVVDLFRLVDEQNVPTAESDLGDTELDSALHIRYPGAHPIRLRTGMVPTAFLFSRTAGIRPDDLRRSIVSLVMSLVGTELGDGSGPRPRADDDYQTFAASFINRGLHRAARAASGIGHRGVSTSLVASMTAPLDELAELVSSRMLAMSVRRLTEPAARPSHAYAGTVRKMFADAGVDELWAREALPVPEPDPLPRGGVAIEQALRDRISDMQGLLDDLRRRVERRAPALAEQFAPRAALERVLRTADFFQAERIVKGVPGDPDPVTVLGFLGMLENRSRQPARPAGVDVQPPAVPRVRGRIGGLSKARWGDPEVAAAVEAQDRWYQWRSRVVWHDGWRRQEQRWRPAAAALNSELALLVEAFRKHVEEEPRAFQEQVQELYDDRTGVSYLLPPQSNLRDFYDDLRERLIKRVNLRDNDDESALLLKLVDGDCWQAAHTAGRRNPAAAVATVKAAVEQRIKTLFAESGMQADERPLLPSMAMLLSAAAGVGDTAEEIGKTALEQFRFKIAGLLPHGFVPEGGGPLKILIVYPRIQNKDAVEEYLRKSLLLPRDGKRSIEFRGVETDSITVVLFRSEMSLTEVPEARNVLRRWARARDVEQSEDVLSWRQRLGYRDDWLASTEEDRRHILHRLLCAMWNGQVTVVEGDADSPRRIRVRLYEEEGPDIPGMTLRLDAYQGEISGWAGLLRSYERWALLDEGRIVEDYCSVLMRVQPKGLSLSGSDPDPLFVRFVNDISRHQLDVLEKLEHQSGPWSAEWARPLRQFWAETLPGALDVPFTEKRALQPTLRTLAATMRGDRLSPRPPDPGLPSGPPGAPRREDDDWGTAPLRRDRLDRADEPWPSSPSTRSASGAGSSPATARREPGADSSPATASSASGAMSSPVTASSEPGGDPSPATARSEPPAEPSPATERPARDDRHDLFEWPEKPHWPERLATSPEPARERPSPAPEPDGAAQRTGDAVTAAHTRPLNQDRADAAHGSRGAGFPWETDGPDRSDPVPQPDPSPHQPRRTAGRPADDPYPAGGSDRSPGLSGTEPFLSAYPPFPAGDGEGDGDGDGGTPADHAENAFPWITSSESEDPSRSASDGTSGTAAEGRAARDPWESDPE